MPVSKEVAAWGMRFLLGQDPENEFLVDWHRNGYETLESLRTAFLRTQEARLLFAEANRSPLDSGLSGLPYSIPPFLLRRPSLPGIVWQFAEPSLEEPVSQLCTSEQMQTQLYRDLCIQLGLDPMSAQRKVWEFAYILAVLRKKGLLSPGKRGLGFGTGREPLPSAFAKAGVLVTATDAPANLDFSEAWANSAQWAQGLEDLWQPPLVDRQEFFDRVQFRPADMNNIPTELRDFDFCWSACCLEHLGSIRKGLDYLRNCLDTLKPGGVSIQTTEFNLGSNGETLEEPSLVLFRKQDIELVIYELLQEGHKVEALNLWPGAMPVDEHIDLPPFSTPHLKLQLSGFTTTSIGIIVTKKT